MRLDNRVRISDRTSLVLVKDSEPNTNGRSVSKRCGRGPSRLQTQNVLLAVGLISLWLKILADFETTWLVFNLLGSLAIALMGMAMGLGFLGFGICLAGDRAVGWLRRAAQWPDE